MDTWILYVFREPSDDSVVLASRHHDVAEALKIGKDYEQRFGYYYRLEPIMLDSREVLKY